MPALHLLTDRLYLIPYTLVLANEIIKGDYQRLNALHLKKGRGWPDPDLMESLPRVVIHLEAITAPTGFETWMIIKKETSEIIGDAGFKGAPDINGEIDLGYGIIAHERRKGYALEAACGLRDWALQQAGVQYITASCQKDNLGSAKILAKVGLLQTSTTADMIKWSAESSCLSNLCKS